MRLDYFDALLASAGTLAIAVAMGTVSPAPIAGQTVSPAPKTAAGTFTPPKMPWGDPDLEGVWPGTKLVGVPMERPKQYGTRAYLTEQELAQREAFAKKQAQIDTAQYVSHDPVVGRGGTFIKCEDDPERCANGVRIGPPNYWDERGTPNLRTSLIMDPPDGRTPALTPEARQAAAECAAAKAARPCSKTSAGCHDSWEDESLWDRCITRGTVGSMAPNTYNEGNQIVQAPGYVVLRNEMIHEARVIPVDGRPHDPPAVRIWMGDSRGHWEDNTLVVEITNFPNHTVIGNTQASDSLRLVERFWLTDANTLHYQVTIDDPRTWTKPWTIEFPLSRNSKYQLYGYACMGTPVMKGNYYMYNALSGARAAEKRASLKN